MHKVFGRSSKSAAGGKHIFWALVILVSVPVLFFLYYEIVHPIITFLYIPQSSIHKGVDYYDDGRYLEFDAGNRLEGFLHATGYTEVGTIVDFYYIDTSWREKPYAKKIADTYSVDIQMDKQDYLEIKETIVNSYSYCGYEGDYILYLSNYQTGIDGDYALIALCDSAYIVRCILLTETRTIYSNSDFISEMRYHSTLDWQAPAMD